jgi:hypothetical protein
LARDNDAFNPAIKDPMVRGSDDWQFPTNECTTLAQFGQIHRGTPWQTIYLKSSDFGITNLIPSAQAWAANFWTYANKWARWTGNRDLQQGFYSRPVRDWSLVATIATMLNTNAPQQLLSINSADTNAWLDVLDGLSALTNVLSDAQLTPSVTPQFDSFVITSNSTQAGNVVASIFATRASQGGGAFRGLGELLASPALSLASPWLNQSTATQLQRGLTDEAYECLPAQLLSLVRADSVGDISVVNGAWQIQFTGFDGYAYVIEASTNLIHWTPVSTNYPANGKLTYVNEPAGGSRYYRSRLWP